MTRDRVFDALSLLYVTAPAVLFLFGYLSPLLSIPLVGVIGYSVARQLARVPAISQPIPGGGLGWPRGTALAVMAVAFAMAAGVGGFAPQDGDYAKHNALFKDLMELQWPLAYQESGLDGQPRVLNIYVGHYLPAGLVGKLLGPAAGFVFSLVWTAVGIWLCLYWFGAILGRHSLWLGALFMLFGGLDVVGYLAVNGRLPAEPINNLSNWMHPLQASMGGLFWIFPSNPGILANGPHHVLPSWLALLMLIHDAVRRQWAGRGLFLWATTTYVSAFFAIGMLPFLACWAVRYRLRELLSFSNTVAFAALVAVAALYLASNDGRFIRGFAWTYVDSPLALKYLVLFYVVSIGLYLLAWPVGGASAVGERLRSWLLTSIGCVLLFPLYRIGIYLDFPIKAWLPSALVFLVCFAEALISSWERGRWRRAIPAAALAAVGCYSGVSLVAWAASSGGLSLDFYRSGIDRVQRLDHVTRSEVGLQFFSDGTSFFWRYLAKPASYHLPDWAGTGPRAVIVPAAFLSDAPSELHERPPRGRVPTAGLDSGRAVDLRKPQLTIEVVMVAGARQVPWAVLASDEAPGGGFAVQQFADRDNRYYLGVASASGALLSTPVAVDTGALAYLAFTYSAGQLTTFVNGVARVTEPAPDGFVAANAPGNVWIGNRKAGDRPFKGRIYEVRITRREMTAEQVSAEWERLRGAP